MERDSLDDGRVRQLQSKLERRHVQHRQQQRRLQRAVRVAEERAERAERARDECEVLLGQLVQENLELKRRCWALEGRGQQQEEEKEEEEVEMEEDLDLREAVFGMLQEREGSGVGISRRAVELVDGMLRGVLQEVVRRAREREGEGEGEGQEEQEGEAALTEEGVLRALQQIMPSQEGVDRVRERAMQMLREQQQQQQQQEEREKR